MRVPTLESTDSRGKQNEETEYTKREKKLDPGAADKLPDAAAEKRRADAVHSPVGGLLLRRRVQAASVGGAVPDRYECRRHSRKSTQRTAQI